MLARHGNLPGITGYNRHSLIPADPCTDKAASGFAVRYR